MITHCWLVTAQASWDTSGTEHRLWLTIGASWDTSGTGHCLWLTIGASWDTSGTGHCLWLTIGGELRHIRDRTFLAVHCRNESRLTSGTGPWKLLTAEASWDLHKDTKIMEIQTHPDRLCGPPSSLYNGHQEYFLGVKRPEHDVDQYPPYRAEFQTE